jgi:hypothetical protein
MNKYAGMPKVTTETILKKCLDIFLEKIKHTQTSSAGTASQQLQYGTPYQISSTIT